MVSVSVFVSFQFSFFSSICLFGIIWVRCLMATCENVFISLQVLMVGMRRSYSCLVIVVPLIPVVMMMDRNIIHPDWVSNGCRVAYFASLLAGLR